MIEFIDNLQVKVVNERKWLIVQSEHIDQCVAFMNSEGFSCFEGIIISRSFGYRENNLDFLKEASSVCSVSISDDINDVSAIYSLLNLKVLHVSEKLPLIDLSCFPNLEELSLKNSKTCEGISFCRELKKLTIESFRSKRGSLESLPELPKLRKLSLFKSNMERLDGIERYSKLESLSLYRCSKLIDINRLCKLPLAVLEIECCKNITNIGDLSLVNNLRVLRLSNCGSIQTISFIECLPLLDVFTFVDTLIVDGDLAPCLKLKEVGFFDKKHYSHKYNEMKQAIGMSDEDYD